MHPPVDMKARIDVLTGFAAEATESGKVLFYVRIPESLQPLARGEQYEDPLAIALADAGVGEVAGGGSQLGEDNQILYCGIDVYVEERDRGLDVIRSTMRRLNAPAGTVIEEFLPEWQELPL